MGANKTDFVNLRMSLGDYRDVPFEYAGRMQIKSIYPSNWEDVYRLDKLWLAKKKASKEAYIDLKIREEEIRHSH